VKSKRVKEKVPQAGLYVTRSGLGDGTRVVSKVRVEVVGTLQFEYLAGRPVYTTPDGKIFSNASDAAVHLEESRGAS